MIDLSMYPNLNLICEKLGGQKKAMLNKQLLAQSEELWNRVSPEYRAKMNEEAAAARQVHDFYVMPSGILGMTNHAFFVLPVYEIVWIYTQVTKTTMNFIPTSKIHSLDLVTRNGESFTLTQATTGGFSKKQPLDDIYPQLQQAFAGTRPGIFYGYDPQLANAVQSNLASVVQAVDAKSQGNA